MLPVQLNLLPTGGAVSADTAQNDDATTDFRCVGGKSSSGAYQAIINLIPPHHTFISVFLGKCGVMQKKRPGERNIGVDLDKRAITWWEEKGLANHEFYQTSALEFLKEFTFWGYGEFVFCDPPYLLETRSYKRNYYHHEFYSPQEHRELLELLLDLPAQVMICGYDSQLYREALGGWDHSTYQINARNGEARTEYLWFNYDFPTKLHDYSFLGGDYREREKVKKLVKRKVAGFQGLSPLVRNAIKERI